MSKTRTQDQQYLEKIQNIEFKPVFILGLHRSGTSILYKMLTETGCFNPVTAYHIIKYDELLYNKINKKEDEVKTELTEYLAENQEDRGIDKLKLDADFAEEYGFLLGQHSSKMYISKENKGIFSEMSRKIQFISENKKPILFKNPYDLINFVYIKQIFPNAKFVFIHRHPFKTLSSTIKAVKFLLEEKNPYTTQLFRLYNVMFESIKSSVALHENVEFPV